jgi:hypothetical protein
MEAAISKEISATPAAGKRTAYCRQQAAECALAATTAILGEVRQAYLNIEQAWLQLAPDINSNSNREKAARPSTAIECEGRSYAVDPTTIGGLQSPFDEVSEAA